MEKWKLNRTNQCKNCPWKFGVNPHDIPYGYCEEKHKALDVTIAKDLSFHSTGQLNIMACHHSATGKNQHCVGWLHNQIGVGNNIRLRLLMMSCENAKDIKVYGDQHEKFEDTLPKQ